MSVKPIVRWAGGKRWLVPELKKLLAGRDFRAYHEPFFGGGAVFLGMDAWKHAYLSDLNADLIHTYQTVRDHPSAVAQQLAQHRNEEAYYYKLRDSTPADPVERAARFIFLNHTSFNGVYRVNLKGQYNVPFGRRRHLRIPDSEHLCAVAARLSGSDMRVGDFATCLENVEENDLVFLDPPYSVAHNDKGFIKYNQNLFAFRDQVRLRHLISQIRDRGASYILTNAAHGSIYNLFDLDGSPEEIWRKNAVGGRAAARGKAAEYLFTNVQIRRETI